MEIIWLYPYWNDFVYFSSFKICKISGLLRGMVWSTMKVRSRYSLKCYPYNKGKRRLEFKIPRPVLGELFSWCFQKSQKIFFSSKYQYGILHPKVKPVLFQFLFLFLFHPVHSRRSSVTPSQSIPSQDLALFFTQIFFFKALFVLIFLDII